MKTLEVTSIAAWRRWLAAHHDSEREVWIIFHKQHSIDYHETLDEALCYGWIDSLVKRLDDDRYARKFTPRKPDSKWSAVNIKRYDVLRANGRLADPGIARPPSGKGHAVRPASAPLKIPKYLSEALSANARAKRCFDELAPSQRRKYVSWIDSAKKEETKRRRLDEALTLLAAGKTLGLK